jgi:hypothetical protein
MSPRVSEPVDVPAALIALLGPSVELRETHMSWVLIPDRACKLKKPVHSAFSTFVRRPPAGTPAGRRYGSTGRWPPASSSACAPWCASRVGSSSPTGTHRTLSTGSSGWSGSTRSGPWRPRFGAIALRHEDVVATARTIERFHADAGRPAVPRWSRQVADAWHADVDELADAGGADVTPARTDAWRRFASGFLHRLARSRTVAARRVRPSCERQVDARVRAGINGRSHRALL